LIRRVGLPLVVTLLGGGLAVAAVAQADAEPPLQLDLQGGAAWVASTTVGQMTLIDGGSAEVVARVAVGEPGGDLTAVQTGMVGYGVDAATGTVARVDPTTFEPGPPVAVIAGASGRVSAHPAGDVIYVVDHERGRVGVADGSAVDTLQGDVQSLAEPVASSVVDDDGRLWALGASSGDLTWFDGPERGGRAGLATAPEDAELVVVAGHVALVERGRRSVHALDGGGGVAGDTCLDVDPTDRTVAVGGSLRTGRLYVVSGDDGLLRVSDLGSGRCTDVAIAVADPGSDLGRPTEAQGRVFVPDYTTGTVAVVDLDRDKVVAHTAELVSPGMPFELFDEDGIVFYNDPASSRAGVISVDGRVAEVAKYDEDRPGAGLDDRDEDEPLPGDAAGDGPGEDPAAAAGGEDDREDDGAGGSDRSGDDPGTDDRGDDPAAGAPSPDDPRAPDDPGGPAGRDGPSDPDDPRGPGPGNEPEGLVEIRANPEVLAGDELALTVAATDGGEVRDVTWDFGDGATGEGETVTHTWDEPRAYVVEVEATVRSGVRASDARTITVQEREPSAPLDAAFTATPTTVEPGAPVSFANETTGDPTSWLWTFAGATGDGTSAERNPPAQTWVEPGEHTVTLTAVRGGERDTHTEVITVVEPEGDEPVLGAIGLSGPAPYDDMTTYAVTATITGDFTSCTWVIDGAGAACRIDGGGGQAVAAIDRQFAAGGHTIRLEVGWGRGRIAATDTTIQVETPPVHADFTVSPTVIEVGMAVTFQDASGGGPTSWEWTFAGATGGGTASGPTPPAQTWAQAGTFDVTLTVRRDAAVDSVTVPVTVEAEQGTPPVINGVFIDAPEPWDDATTYEIVTTGLNLSIFRLTCTWFVDGQQFPCVEIPPHFPELFEYRLTHRFTPGPHTIRVVIGWGDRGRTVSSETTVQIADA
jgi:PKD repeat protein